MNNYLSRLIQRVILLAAVLSPGVLSAAERTVEEIAEIYRVAATLAAGTEGVLTHPYVVGIDFISRYLMVAENCSRAELSYR